MAIYVNQTRLRGYLGEDAILKMTNKGQPVLSGKLCINEFHKRKLADGSEEKVETPNWFKFEMWGNLATTMDRVKLKKGDLLEIEGKTMPDNWVNNQTGEKHNDKKILVFSAQKLFLPKNDAAQGPQVQNDSVFGNSVAQGYQQAAQQQFADDEGLPF